MDGAQKCRATEKKGRERRVDGEERRAGGEWREEKMTTDEWAGRKSVKTTALGERSRPSEEGRGPRHTERELLL